MEKKRMEINKRKLKQHNKNLQEKCGVKEVAVHLNLGDRYNDINFIDKRTDSNNEYCRLLTLKHMELNWDVIDAQTARAYNTLRNKSPKND